jgi:hypothetical protein
LPASRLAAVDEAIGEQGWKIVALLRLSPAVPFNLQNYLYGVTAVRFWPAVLASWVAMLPGTFMYVYLGSLGRTAAAGGTTPLEWVLRVVGLAATVVVTVYIARLASAAIQRRTRIAGADGSDGQRPPTAPAPASPARVATLAWVAVVVLTVAVWASARQDAVRASVERILGLPPVVTAVDVYGDHAGEAAFDHSMFDTLLGAYVDADGFVDYAGLLGDAARLDAYLDQLAAAPFDALGRDEKLALLINAYNAFTLRLILDHYPVASIQDIPAPERWDAVRWRVGPHTWSLNQIEHEEIRPKFVEPRIHFALVCAAVGCPPLRAEAYPRWRSINPVRLTPYDWYGRYNLVVIGAGHRRRCVWTAAGSGRASARRSALVERDLLGGDCLNVGCVPSKALIRAAARPLARRPRAGGASACGGDCLNGVPHRVDFGAR